VFLHKKGARQPDALNPDYWAIDTYAFSIPEKRTFMSRLFMNLLTNIQPYPEWDAHLKDRAAEDAHRLGTKRPAYSAGAAEAVKRIVLTAELRYFDGGPLRSTSTPTRSQRRSSRRSRDRNQLARCGWPTFAREQELPVPGPILQFSSPGRVEKSRLQCAGINRHEGVSNEKLVHPVGRNSPG
jgi:hypothetical protein